MGGLASVLSAEMVPPLAGAHAAECESLRQRTSARPFFLTRACKVGLWVCALG